LKRQAEIFKDKQSLKVIYTVKGKTEAPYVDTTLIHKIVCQLATLYQQLNRSLNFHEIKFKNLLDNR